MRRLEEIVLAACTLVLVACGESTSTRTLRFSHYMTPCVGVGERLCYVNEDTGELEYVAPKGWTFRWGFRHELLVAVEDVANPLADAPSVEYTVLEQKAEPVPPGTRFSIPLFSRTLVTRTGGSTVSLLNRREIDCGARGLCAELLASLEDARPCLSLELSHPSLETEPLVLEGIAPYHDGECANAP